MTGPPRQPWIMTRGTLRGRRSPRCRSRVDSLPQTSLAFVVLVALLAVWFSAGGAVKSDFKLDNSLLDVSVSRNEAGLDGREEAGDSYDGLCSKEGSIFSSNFALLFLIPGVIAAFIGLAIVTDDYFVAALERICERLNLTEDVAGATFMAAGSSAPEFFTSLLGVFVTEDEVGIGTVVGSAVFNILIIIGLSGALAGAALKLDWRPLARDSFFYVMSIVLLLVFVMGPTRGQIDWWEGLALVGGYGVYVLFMAFGNKPYMRWTEKLLRKKTEETDRDLEIGTDADADDFSSPGVSGRTRSPIASPTASLDRPAYSSLNPRSKFRAAQFAVIAANRLANSSSDSDHDDAKTFLGVEMPEGIVGWLFFPVTFLWRLAFRLTIVDCSTEKNAKWWWVTFITSIIWISGISYVMVEAARISGCLIGIPASAMGLTVIAAGTSVPDALASVAVARNGAGDMAVSNAIGSNVFDILLGLGFPWFLGALIKEPTLIPVEPIGIVVIPILILFAIIISLLVLLVILRWKLSKRLGFILFGIYGLFVTYTLLDVYVFKFSSTGA